ncbi:hypothetical protein TrVE_jg13235 [Triparma verrucosa]|uniref:Uncharacterized protein n=1 Tax=Triparma verrucosa TaxID=1606542 RepID=A0A9W7BBV1_9STRA|nr:hypothetical protein TrVE_jg13235 [Triparma verrucosa]
MASFLPRTEYYPLVPPIDDAGGANTYTHEEILLSLSISNLDEEEHLRDLCPLYPFEEIPTGSFAFAPLQALPPTVPAPYNFPLLLQNLTKLTAYTNYPYHSSLLPLLHLPPPTLRLFVSHFQTLKISPSMAAFISGLTRNTYRTYKLVCYAKIIKMIKTRTPPPLAVLLSFTYLLSSLSHVFPPYLFELLPPDDNNIKLAVLVATHLTYSHCNEHCYVGDTLEADLERSKADRPGHDCLKYDKFLASTAAFVMKFSDRSDTHSDTHTSIPQYVAAYITFASKTKKYGKSKITHVLISELINNVTSLHGLSDVVDTGLCRALKDDLENDVIGASLVNKLVELVGRNDNNDSNDSNNNPDSSVDWLGLGDPMAYCNQINRPLPNYFPAAAARQQFDNVTANIRIMYLRDLVNIDKSYGFGDFCLRVGVRIDWFNDEMIYNHNLNYSRLNIKYISPSYVEAEKVPKLDRRAVYDYKCTLAVREWCKPWDYRRHQSWGKAFNGVVVTLLLVGGRVNCPSELVLEIVKFLSREDWTESLCWDRECRLRTLGVYQLSKNCGGTVVKCKCGVARYCGAHCRKKGVEEGHKKCCGWHPCTEKDANLIGLPDLRAGENVYFGGEGDGGEEEEWEDLSEEEDEDEDENAEIFTSSTAQATFSAPTTPLQDVIAFFKNNVYKPSGRFTKGLGNGDESSSSGEEEHEEDWDTDDFEGEESESDSDHE